MSRNAESRFAVNPTNIDIKRSRFHRPSSVKTTFNVGDLIPFYVDEVLPGDTFDITTSKVVRTQTLVAPIMDNIYLDTYYFFVPNRLVWEHWKELMGENTNSAWYPSTAYSVPQITAPAFNGWYPGTIADYMGIPTYVKGLSVNALPIRAYALICDQWFRDENVTDPLYISFGDALVGGTNGTNYRSDVAKGSYPFKVAKYHDYFTSALPSPQKGPDVLVPFGPVPVVTRSIPHFNNTSIPMTLYESIDDGTVPGHKQLWDSHEIAGNMGYVARTASSASSGDASSNAYWMPSNLYADFSIADGYGNFSNPSINALRLAFQIQRLFERDARGGTRYIEVLKSHFSVTSPDSRLQRAEYLGGNRIPINIHQVLSTAETSTGDIGETGAYSLTVDSHSDFVRSFTEHGFVIGVMCARYDHSYQQGLERMWTRKDRLDYYWPVLANIGEKSIRNDEIYAQGPAVVDSNGDIIDEQTFGYQEAWAEYRYKPSHVTGEMRSNVSTSLDAWHLADNYSQLPTLSDAWIREDKSNVGN